MIVETMNEVLSCFQEGLEIAGIELYLADHDPESEKTGFGIGMHWAQRRFLAEQSPCLVLGIESEAAMVDRGFGAFLHLPWVCYLEALFTLEELSQAAAALPETPVDASTLDDLRRDVSARGFESIRRNVSHCLEGAVHVALRQAVRVLGQVSGEAELSRPARRQLEASIISIASSDGKVQASINALQREIDSLRGIADPQVLKALCDQYYRLQTAPEYLDRLVERVGAWMRRDTGPEGLDELAEAGAQVSRNFCEAVAEFTRLAGQQRGAE